MLTLDDAHRRALLVDRQLVGCAVRARRTPVDVVRSVGPLHSTDPSSAYLQIAARADLTPAAIAASFYTDRALVRHTTLRRTVHLLTPELATVAHRAYNHRLVPKLRTQLVDWIGASGTVATDPQTWLGAVEERVVAAVRELERPTGGELADAVPELQTTFDPAPGKAYSRPMRITSKVIELLVADGRLARDRPRSGDLTSGAWTYSPIERWLPDGFVEMSPPAALTDLVRARLAQLPGCSHADLAWWTGLPKGQIVNALGGLDVVDVRRDDGETGWALAADDLAAPDPPDDAIALLPGLDATPMGCKQREWFLGAHADALFDRSGNVGPTVWWKGHVVGGWTQRADGTVVTELLEPVPHRARRAIDDEAQRLAAWLGEVRVKWRYPTPLQRSLE